MLNTQLHVILKPIFVWLVSALHSSMPIYNTYLLLPILHKIHGNKCIAIS